MLISVRFDSPPSVNHALWIISVWQFSCYRFSSLTFLYEVVLTKCLYMNWHPSTLELLFAKTEKLFRSILRVVITMSVHMIRLKQFAITLARCFILKILPYMSAHYNITHIFTQLNLCDRGITFCDYYKKLMP